MAEANGSGRSAELALFKALVAGDASAVQAALAAGADPNAADAVAGIAPLTWASAHAPDCIGMLVDAGADPWAELSTGRPISKARELGQWAAFEAMMAEFKGSIPKGSLEDEWRSAVRRGQVEPLATLVAAGVGVDAPVFNENATALIQACAERKPGMVKALLELGADPNASYPEYTREGEPAGACCAAVKAINGWGSVECLDLLLRAGARPDFGSPGALAQLAAGAYDEKMAKPMLVLLLRAGVDFAAAEVGGPALSIAVGRNRVEAVEWLCAVGADPSAKAKGGKSALDMARQRPDLEASALVQALDLSRRERRSLDRVSVGAKPASRSRRM